MPQQPENRRTQPAEPPHSNVAAGLAADRPTPDLRITTSPGSPDEVLLHLPEWTYWDTQAWSAEVGIPTAHLPALRDAIDEHLATTGAEVVTVITGPTRRVLDEVYAERARQDDQQDYPPLDPRDIDIVTRHHNASRANNWRQVNQERATPSSGSRCATCPGSAAGPHPHTAWDGLLLEAMYWALGEDHPIRQRHRLLQLAALAAANIEAIDRCTAGEQR